MKVSPLLVLVLFASSSYSMDLCNKCECSSEILDCRHHQILQIEDGSTVPSSIQRMYLSGLDLQYFGPTTLNITDSRVELLDLSGNQLETVEGNSFQMFPHLKKLHLENNKINSLKNNSFKHLKNLTHLNLSYNRVSHLPQDMLTHVQHLTHLRLKYNFMKEIPVGFFRQSQSLAVLDLSYLMIEKLDDTLFNWHMILEKLDLSHNYLEEVPSYLLQYLGSTLAELDLSGNLFETIPQDAFPDLVSLKTIYLDQLLRLKKIEPYAFSSQENLDSIQLRYLPKLNAIDDKAFHIISNDTSINMTRAPIYDLTISFTTLPTLSRSLLDWTKLRQVSLIQNRWACDCAMAWIKNSTLEVLAGISMFCYTPSQNKGITVLVLEEKDFTCSTTRGIQTPGGIIWLAFLFMLAFLVALLTIATLVYREKGWLLQKPQGFERLQSQESSITVYEREVYVAPEAARHIPPPVLIRD